MQIPRKVKLIKVKLLNQILVQLSRFQHYPSLCQLRSDRMTKCKIMLERLERETPNLHSGFTQQDGRTRVE